MNKILFLILALVLSLNAFSQRQISDTRLILGLGTDVDVKFEVDKTTSNNPFLEWDVTTGRWLFSHDGVTSFRFVGETETQTLTNKTLTSPVINSPTGLVKADVGLSNVDNTSDATKNAATATLTNKTINADSNTITNIENADIKAGAAIDASKIADGSVSSTEFQYIGTLSSNAQTQIDSKQSTLTNSAGLAAALSDETGTGLAVFSDSPTFSGTVTVPDRTASDNSGAAANTKYVDAAIATVVAGGVNEASASVKGILKLTNDLGGTADLPTVPALANSSALATKISDETGSGSLVFGTAPSLNGTVTVKAQSGVTAPLANTNLHVSGADGTASYFSMDTYGGLGSLIFRTSNGTQSSPTAVTTARALGGFLFYGYGSTGYSSSQRTSMLTLPTETWTDSAQGTDFRIATTVTGTTTTANRFYIDGTGSVVIGNGSTAANASAILDVVSTTKGVRFPRMTQTQRDAITQTQGLEVYNTTTDRKNISTGTFWDIGQINGGQPSIRPSLILDFANSRTLDPRITFTRATTRTCVNAKGLIETLAAGVPCFDHDPTTLESLGLLIEEQRQNQILQSETFDNASWTKVQSTITANATASPDGATTADKLVENATTNDHYVAQTGIPFTSGVSYSWSAFVKAGERTRVLLSFGTAAFGANSVIFNLSTGEIVSSSGATGSIKAYPNGWYRLTTVDTATSTTSTGVNIFLVNDSNSTNYLGDGTSGLFIWGAQLEVASFPSSYTGVTTASSFTRNSDQASMTGTNFSSWFRQDEGTMVVSGRPSAAYSAATNIAVLSDGTTNNRVQVNYNATTLILTMFAATSGVTQVSSTTTPNAPTVGAKFTSSLAYKLNDYGISLNGNTVVSDNSATVPTVDRLSIAASATGAVANAQHISQFYFYPKRLTNAELQAVTR